MAMTVRTIPLCQYTRGVCARDEQVAAADDDRCVARFVEPIHCEQFIVGSGGEDRRRAFLIDEVDSAGGEHRRSPGSRAAGTYGVAVGENTVYIGDRLNRRVVRVRLTYAAEALQPVR